MSKTAIVTGGSRGIGLGIAKELAAAGFQLMINGVRPEKDVAESLNSLESTGVKVGYCQGDIGKSKDRSAIVESALSRFGSVQVLVNNAGVAPLERKDLLEMSEASYDRVMEINLRGTFFLTQLVAGHMVKSKQQQPGTFHCIVNISSISATVASTNRGEYCISKAGLSMVTSLFSTRLGTYDIPVYEVRPGIIATDMTAGVKEKYDQLFGEGMLPQSRWGQPEDVGRAVGALAEGKFGYSTGQVIMVDGGLTIPRL